MIDVDALDDVADDEARYAFTWFRHAKESKSGVRVTMRGSELEYALANPGRGTCAKTDLPLISTATFRGNHRLNDNVETVAMLGLDIDTPHADPEALIASLGAALGGVEVFACSTFSSAPGAFKLRALVPYDRPASADEHRESWRMIAAWLADKGIYVDRACSDPARGFYVWAIPENGAYWHGHVGGAPWPVGVAAEMRRKSEARLAADRPAMSTPAGDTYARARAYVAKMPEAIAGAHGHDATFSVARKIVQDFGLFAGDAWSLLLEYNSRCQPPWSERDLRHKLDSAVRARVAKPMGDSPRD